MFQAVGVFVVAILALYGAYMMGWLPPEMVSVLPRGESAHTEKWEGQKPFEALSPDEKTFTERVTGEPNPYK